MAKPTCSSNPSAFGFEEQADGTSARVALATPDIYSEVDEALGLFEAGSKDPETRTARLHDAIDAFGVVWDFCFENGKGKLVEITSPKHLQVVLRRFVVLTMMFRAKLLPKHTLRSIAKLLPRDVEAKFAALSRVPVSKIGLEAAKRFEFQSRVQKPAASIENYREAAKRGHKKRKAKARKQSVCQTKQKAVKKKTASVARQPKRRTPHR